jgi:hypothetical protein
MTEHHPAAPGALGPPGRGGLRALDTEATLHRLRWAERGPWILLLLVALAALAALALGEWLVALVIAGLLLPDRVRAIGETRNELRALAAQDDFLDALRKRIEQQTVAERTSLFLRLAAAAGLALLSRTEARGAAVLAVMAAVTLVWAVVRFAVVAPRLARELEDLGGRVPGGWAVAILIAALTLAAPFLVLYGSLRRAVRRARGLPEETEEQDA